MGENGPVGELGLVLEPDLVWGFVVPYHMLEDHNLQHLPCLLGKFALVG